MPSPQNERELVARLAPESPILFARARHLLRDLTPNAVDRFRVGEPENGCWSVTHNENSWQSTHRHQDASTTQTSDHPTAKAATAHAVGGLLAEDGVSLSSTILRTAGLIDRDKGIWALTEAAQRIVTETENAPRPSGTDYIALEGLAGRAGYFVREPSSAPTEGPFVDARTVLSMAAFAELPDSPSPLEPSEILPNGTLLDGYGDTGAVFLYEPGTPFNRRGLWGGPYRHPHRFYEVRTPLRVYPSFPFEMTTISVEDITGPGRGYYLVDTVADLLASGALSETTERP